MLTGYKTLTLTFVCTTESQSLSRRFAGTKYTVDVIKMFFSKPKLSSVVSFILFILSLSSDCIFNSEDGFKSRFQDYSDLLDELCPSHTVK